MSIELKILSFTVPWGIFLLLATGAMATKQRGVKWNLSSRDQPAPPLTGIAGRIERALKNFLETYPFFIVATLLIEITHKHSSLSTLGSELYILGRILHFFIYAAGIEVIRTIVWLVSLAGILMMMGALFT